MPTGKIGVYTRFFEFANFRLPLSTFLVNVLRHYRINLSQLSVIAATKVSHFEILCRVHGIESKEGLFHCFYVNSKNKGWMSFKTYLFAFIQVGDPTKVSGYERLKEQIEEFQDVQTNIVNDKVAQLDADLLEMALHMEEKFYPHFLTTTLRAAISRVIEKGMQDELSAGIDHGKAGRNLADDASVEDIMNILRLDGPLADAPVMSDLQPYVDQLMLPVHQYEDQVVLGETSLSFALSVTHSRVQRIRENVVAKWSALIGVWTPLVDPLSIENLTGEAGTFDGVPTTTTTTTALSTTFASARSVPPITIEDYEIVGMDGPKDSQGNGQGNIASFPIVEFEKEELDTTPERDPPS
nr:putative transposase (putative), gypsy type [Tanacetum cinerariifolium]